MEEKLKTQIKSAVYYYIDSNDRDLREYECGHYSSLDYAADRIASSKMYSSEKFRHVDYDDNEEFEYFKKVEERFIRFLKYYLDPNKSNGLK